ncbi:MAG: beta-propeller domain-containing protein [Microthrixaceae bacterium]
MNDDPIDGGTDMSNPDEIDRDREIDRELASVGAALRDSTDPGRAEQVITLAGQRKVARLQRTNRILAIAAAVLVVAMIGSLAWVNTEGSSHSEVASGEKLQAPGLRKAEKLVAALPAEPVDPHNVQLVSTVSRYDTCDALADQLRKVGAAHVGSQGFGANRFDLLGYRFAGYRAQTALADAPAPEAQNGAGGDVAPSGSGGETLGTNVIVDGVDEPDTVKAVGSLVVELRNMKLRVVDTGRSAVVGTLTLGGADPKSGHSWGPMSLLVDGNRAVVFGTETVLADPLPGDPSATRPATNYMTVTFVSLVDPASPKVTQRVRIEGGLVAARRVGESVRIVTNSSLNDLAMVAPTTTNGVAPALHQNRLAVAQSSVDDWIPEWDTGVSTKSTPLVDCAGVVVPDTFAGVEMTSLVQFDMDGPFEPRAMGILAPSETLTATAGDVVVASHVWVDPVNQTGDYKDWSTALHRFSFDDSGPEYVGSGQVKGSIRDEFSLGVLNASTVGVVTVEGVPWSIDNAAKITVRSLVGDASAKTLTEAGSLVPASSSQGVSGLRFMGDRLLISSGLAGVTVSSVDLSTPTAPKDAGAVDLPGTGGYFHPFGDSRVLVIGSTIRVVGKQVVPGTHATILDISGAPKILGTWNRDWTSSNVAWDHHEFTWWNSMSMGAFGANVGEGPLGSSVSQAVMLNVGANDVTARLVRPRDADLGRLCPWDQVDRNGCDDSGPPQVSRVLVVAGSPWIYTSESLEQLDAASLAPKALITLPPIF